MTTRVQDEMPIDESKGAVVRTGADRFYNAPIKSNTKRSMPRTYDEIQSDIQRLQEEAQEALARERLEVIERIRAEMAKFDISVAELIGGAPVARRGAPAGKLAAPVRKSATEADKVTPAAAGAGDAAGESGVSPAVRLLEEAGIDFRRKPAPSAESANNAAGQPARAAKSVATGSASRKVAAKSARKA